MSTKTEWEIEVDMVVIDQNISVFINATAEGLKVDDLIIPWAEIDEARALVTEADPFRPQKYKQDVDFDKWWEKYEKWYTSDALYMSEYHMANSVWRAARGYPSGSLIARAALGMLDRVQLAEMLRQAKENKPLSET